MKSYFLGPIPSRTEAAAALTSILPGQAEPWLLKHTSGNAIAYFNLADPEEEIDTPGTSVIQADMSGRHYNEDAAVIEVLEKIRQLIGGSISDDH